ncbi:hypothetical protein AX16_008947 [Volvariella volvacea WC 439]|nr:hypothetical protein AX16_008947 [Volvariella volvacea WC 439]
MALAIANSSATSLTTASINTSNLDFDEEFTALSVSPPPSEFSATEDGEAITHSKGKSRSGLNPHPEYFFEDGNLLIRVENVDFKIHRYFFMRDSATFRQLSKNGVLGRIFDNGDDENDATEYTTPLMLEGLKSLDFERFLGVLYPTRFDQDEANTAAYWASVLNVASFLSFCSIRSLSIEKLSLVAQPIEKIALGRQYSITHWLKGAYHTICTRPATLTKEEGRRIGVDEVIGIMEARQILLWEKPNATDAEQYKVVSRIFGLEPVEPTSASATSSTSHPVDGGQGIFNAQMQRAALESQSVSPADQPQLQTSPNSSPREVSVTNVSQSPPNGLPSEAQGTSFPDFQAPPITSTSDPSKLATSEPNRPKRKKLKKGAWSAALQPTNV